jgi:hypothetical protein
VTRQLLGLAGLDVGFLAAGTAMLAGLGLVRNVRQGVRAAGLAVVAGWAATGVIVSVALALTVPFSAWTIVAIWLLLAAAGLGAARLVPERRPAEPRGETTWLGRVLAVAGAALVLMLMGAFLWRAAVPTGVLNPDVWNFWLPKAKSIHYFGTLDTHSGGFTSYDNPDYPPLDPALEATSFRFMGSAAVMRLPVQHWAIAFSFVLAVAFLLRERVRPAILWPAVAMLAAMPVFHQLIGSLLADEPLAILFALAGVCGALWVSTRDRWAATLGGLFLAATTLTKNEGLMLSMIVVIVLALALRRPSAWRELALLVALPPIAVAVIWKLWLVRHGVPASSHYHFTDLFRPGFLADRLDRLRIGARGILKQLILPTRTLLVIPVAIGFSVLLARARPALVLLAPLTALLVFLGYAAIYWISPIEVHFYVKAAPRIATAPVLFCAALFPLLMSAAFAQTSEARG